MFKINKKKKNLYNQKNDNKIFDYYYLYNSHFFHSLIFRGRKLWAFNFLIKIKYTLKKKESMDPNFILLVSLYKITPEIIIFPFHKGRFVNKVAMPITLKKQITFACKWIIKSLKDKYRIINLRQIVELLINSVYNSGIAIEKKKNVYTESIKNKQFLYYLK